MDQNTIHTQNEVFRKIIPKGSKPKNKFRQTQILIARLEEIFASKVIVYYTAQSISPEHIDKFLDHLEHIGKQERITLINITNGGYAHVSKVLINLIRQYCSILDIVVSSHCGSASTDLSLGANTILMTPTGSLSPVDIALHTEFYSLKDKKGIAEFIFYDQVKRIIHMLQADKESAKAIYTTLFKYLDPLTVAKFELIKEENTAEIDNNMQSNLASYGSKKNIEKIVAHLIEDYPSHYYPILYQEAKEIGLPVKLLDNHTSYLLYKLVNLYYCMSKEQFIKYNENLYYIIRYPSAIESARLRTMSVATNYRQFRPPIQQWENWEYTVQWRCLLSSGDHEHPRTHTAVPLETYNLI